MTAPDGVNNKRCRNYDDPVSMLDRGATMSVKDPITLQNQLNIVTPSNIAQMVTKAGNVPGYANFDKNHIDNTSQDTFVYKAEKSNQIIQIL